MLLSESLSNEPLSVSDLKQFVYCPKIPYFMHVLGFRERITECMKEGTESEDRIVRLEERRRKLAKKLNVDVKLFDVNLCSEKLGLVGTIDCVVVRGMEVSPVEFKSSPKPKKVSENHLIQLVAYALLLESCMKKVSKKGYIVYEKSDDLLEFSITEKMKRYTMKKIEEVKRIIAEEVFPETRQPASKCTSCGYRKVCQPYIPKSLYSFAGVYKVPSKRGTSERLGE
ncbi:MAG: CRISPR-associated protein Cas4 [Nitrososphaerota archaeon]